MLVSYFLCYDFFMGRRPAFEEIKTYEEFSKYYWYCEELAAICRISGCIITVNAYSYTIITAHKMKY